jgi:hypothetical protein
MTTFDQDNFGYPDSMFKFNMINKERDMGLSWKTLILLAMMKRSSFAKTPNNLGCLS